MGISAAMLKHDNCRFESYFPLLIMIDGIASSASLADLWMVGAVKVKCLRVRSEGWSPYIFNYYLSERVVEIHNEI